MDRNRLMSALMNYKNANAQIKAAMQLKHALDDPSVLSAVCLVACETTNNQARGAILAALCSHSNQANRMFKKLARHSERAVIRKRALMNLCLGECRSARSIVLRGLHDRSAGVRFAAALHIGLYLDAEAQLEFKRFLESHRAVLASAHLKQSIVHSWHWTKRFCLQAAKHRNAVDRKRPPKLKAPVPSMAGLSGAVSGS